MNLNPIALKNLDPGQRTVMHIGALLPAVVVAIGGTAIGIVVHEKLGWPAWPPIVFAGAVALWALILSPRRRWAAWGWSLTADELHVAHGVWTKVHTVVPLARVQHLDVAQDPVERAAGVARLILHTAGTSHAIIVLPGISRPTAENLRDTIRAHVRAELW